MIYLSLSTFLLWGPVSVFADDAAREETAAPADEMEPFELEMSLTIEAETIPCSIFFYEHYAVEFDVEDAEQVAAVYDLGAMSWFECEASRTVPIEVCERWAADSEARARQSLAATDDEAFHKLIELSLEPMLTTTEEEESLTITNEMMTFHFTQPLTLSELQRERYFAYDRLNAYRKAILNGKLAPFLQLAVDEELESREFAPGAIELVIAAPTGEVRLLTTFEISSLDEDELTRVQEAIDLVPADEE